MTEYEKLKAWTEERSFRDPDTGCLVWKRAGAHGGKEPQGRYLGKVILVRRALVEAKRDTPLTLSVTVKCTCETPMCIEETHLRVKRRVGRKGQKWSMGERAKIARATRASRRGKLKPEAVADIRSKQEPRAVYAQRYGIAQEYVSDIQSYRAWKDYASPFAGLGARP